MDDVQDGQEIEQCPDSRNRHDRYLGLAARVVYLLISIVGLATACLELYERLRH